MMALHHAFEGIHSRYQYDPYYSQPYTRYWQSKQSFPPPLKNSFGYQSPAQNRQGIVPIIIPLGLLITLAATVATALFTNFVNAENNRRFLQSQAANAINPVAAPPVISPPFVPMTTITVRVIDIAVANAESISDRRVTLTPQTGSSSVLMGTTNNNGELTVTVPIGVEYLVEVTGTGLITPTQTTTSTASSSTIIMPISGVLPQGTIVPVLTWASAIEDLDLAALTSSCDCLLNFAGTVCTSGNPGTLTSSLREDTILSTGIEILTIEGASGDFLIFANNPEEEPNFEATGAVITVFSGSTFSSANVPTTTPNAINLFWLAGEFSDATEMLTPSNNGLMEMDLGTCDAIITQNYG